AALIDQPLQLRPAHEADAVREVLVEPLLDITLQRENHAVRGVVVQGLLGDVGVAEGSARALDRAGIDLAARTDQRSARPVFLGGRHGAAARGGPGRRGGAAGAGAGSSGFAGSGAGGVAEGFSGSPGGRGAGDGAAGVDGAGAPAGVSAPGAP